MSRQLRIEYEHALYHITSRGNNRENIYYDDEDRGDFLEILSEVCQRYHWLCHAYCLMSNHYHLLVETVSPTLSKGMHYLNGVYTHHYNMRHHHIGHLFQGRFKAILVEKEGYLLELARYIVLNPVRAKMTQSAKDWIWSSYCATAGLVKAHESLYIDWILSCFTEHRSQAFQQYQSFVQFGLNKKPMSQVRNQIYLGTDKFINQAQTHALLNINRLNGVPNNQKHPRVEPLSYYAQLYPSRDEAMMHAYLSGGYTLQKVGSYFGVSESTVRRALKRTSQ